MCKTCVRSSWDGMTRPGHCGTDRAHRKCGHESRFQGASYNPVPARGSPSAPGATGRCPGDPARLLWWRRADGRKQLATGRIGAGRTDEDGTDAGRAVGARRRRIAVTSKPHPTTRPPFMAACGGSTWRFVRPRLARTSTAIVWRARSSARPTKANRAHCGSRPTRGARASSAKGNSIELEVPLLRPSTGERSTLDIQWADVEVGHLGMQFRRGGTENRGASETLVVTSGPRDGIKPAGVDEMGYELADAGKVVIVRCRFDA